MDERRLTDMFQDAVGDPPPASFTAGDILTESRRQTVRQRNRIALGSAFGVAALATGIVIGPGLLSPTPVSDTVLAEGGSSRSQGDPGVPISPEDTVAIPGGPPSAGTVPEGPQQRGGHPAVTTTGQGGCADADPELAGVLAAGLPDGAGTAGLTPLRVGGQCPSGTRAVGYLVRSQDAEGFISLVLLPGDQTADQPVGPRSSGDAKAFAARTQTGKTLVLRSDPRESGSPGPYLDSLQIMAQKLASDL